MFSFFSKGDKMNINTKSKSLSLLRHKKTYWAFYIVLGISIIVLLVIV